MVWPVYGEVVMPFSVTALVFDPTMDRYSTNDNMRIAAREGDPVRAGADGKIISIGRDFWRGNYVTIDHGDGWVSTLGQLMENVLVREGEVVRAGQVIGGIGQPTISGSLNGPHLHLHITHNSEPINPMDLLQAQE
jgi:murein DD-endopeptidase MepM/ murein hydrolase activator NlpD